MNRMSIGKRLFTVALLLAIILLLTLMSQAAHVQFQWVQFGLQIDQITNRTTQITPASAPGGVSGTFIVTTDRRTYTNDAAGQFIASNVVAGVYRIELAGPTAKTIFLISVPDTNGLIQAASLISSPTNLPASFPFYVTHSSGGLVTPANFFTKGVIAGTNILVENWTNRVRISTTGLMPGSGGNLNQFTNVAMWGNATNINNFWLLGTLRVPNLDEGAILFVDDESSVITDGVVMYTNVTLKTTLTAATNALQAFTIAATNTSAAYARGLTNGFVGVEITNGLASLAYVIGATNAAGAYSRSLGTNMIFAGSSTNYGTLYMPNLQVARLASVNSAGQLTNSTLDPDSVVSTPRVDLTQFGTNGGNLVIRSSAYVTNMHLIASAEPPIEAWTGSDPKLGLIIHNSLNTFPIEPDGPVQLGTETVQGLGFLQLSDGGDVRHTYLGGSNNIFSGAVSIGTNDQTFVVPSLTGPHPNLFPAQLHVFQQSTNKDAVRIQNSAGHTNNLLTFYNDSTQVGSVNSNGVASLAQVILAADGTVAMHAVTKGQMEAYVAAGTNALSLVDYKKNISATPFTNTGPVTITGGLTNTGATLLSGTVTLGGDATAALHAVTKQQMDAAVGAGGPNFVTKINSSPFTNTGPVTLSGGLTNSGRSHFVGVTEVGSVGAGTTNSPLRVYKTGADQDVVQTWTYSSAFDLRLKQAIDAGVVRWAFDQTNNSISYSNVLVLDRGSVGIGEVSPASKLSVSGGATIGTSYDTTAAPAQGLLVEGSLGIGTTTPLAKLTVKESGSGFVNIGQLAGSSANSGITFSINSSTNVQLANYSMLGDGVNTLFGRPSGGDMYFREANSGQMILKTSTGNLGIGTISPSQKLDVHGSAAISNQVTVGRNASAALEVAPFQQLNATNTAILATIAANNITTSNGVLTTTATYTNALRLNLLGQWLPLGPAGLTNVDLSYPRRYHTLTGNETISLTSSTSTYWGIQIQLYTNGAASSVSFPAAWVSDSGGSSPISITGPTLLVIRAVTNKVHIDWSGTNAGGGGTITTIAGVATNLTVHASNTVNVPLIAQPRTGTATNAFQVNTTNGSSAFFVSPSGSAVSGSNFATYAYSLGTNDGTGTNFVWDVRVKSWTLREHQITNLINVVCATNQMDGQSWPSRLIIHTGNTNRHYYQPVGWYRANTNTPILLSSNRVYIADIETRGTGETNVYTEFNAVALQTSYAPQLVGDAVGANVWAMYSTARKLKYAYAGPLIFVREYSGAQSSAPIYADGSGRLDTNAIKQFIIDGGSTDAYVESVCDQSGNGRHITNSVSLARIAHTSTLIDTLSTGHPAAYFTIAGNTPLTNFSGSFPQPATVYFVGQGDTYQNSTVFYGGGASGRMEMNYSGFADNIEVYAGTASSDITITDEVAFMTTATFSGANSSFSLNRGLQLWSGSAGTAAPDGFTVGADGPGIKISEIHFAEAFIFTVDDPDGGARQLYLQDEICDYYGF